MGEEYYKKLFSKNLRNLMEKNNKTQVDLIKDLGITRSAISTWVNGTRLPRMDKVDLLARYFHCNRSDLIEEPNEDTSGYYQNEETAQIAQEIFESKALRGLFDAARTAPPEDLKMAHDMLMALKKKEQGYRDEGC